MNYNLLQHWTELESQLWSCAIMWIDLHSQSVAQTSTSKNMALKLAEQWPVNKSNTLPSRGVLGLRGQQQLRNMMSTVSTHLQILILKINKIMETFLSTHLKQRIKAAPLPWLRLSGKWAKVHWLGRGTVNTIQTRRETYPTVSDRWLQRSDHVVA